MCRVPCAVWLHTTNKLLTKKGECVLHTAFIFCNNTLPGQNPKTTPPFTTPTANRGAVKQHQQRKPFRHKLTLFCVCLLAAIGLSRERGGGGPAVESNEAFFGLVRVCLRGSSGQNGKNTHKGCFFLPFRPSLPRNGYRRITDSASVFLAIVFGTLARSKRFSYGIFFSLRSPFFYRFAPGLSLLA